MIYSFGGKTYHYNMIGSAKPCHSTMLYCYDQFQNESQRLLHMAITDHQNVIFMGDLNCDMLHRSNDMPVRNICDIFGLTITITDHTFTSKNGVLLIDVLFN